MVLLSFATIGMIFTFLTLLVADLVLFAFYRAEHNCVKADNKYLGNPGYYYRLLILFGKITIIYAGLAVTFMAVLGIAGH
jgi:hypothetical protein